jgi:hypothetical protein
VAVEAARGVSASYFFTVYPAEPRSYHDCVYAPDDRCVFRGETRTVASVMQELAREGFDVGLHGGYFSATCDEALRRQKETLENAVGLSITTTRQHWLHWRVDRTPRLQVSAGLRADSTLGFNRNVGFRAGTSLPFFQFDLRAGERLDLVEVPLIVQEGALFSANALELDRRLAKDVLQATIDRIADVGGVASFLVHPHSLLNPDVLFLYEWALDYALDLGAWVASVRDIDHWWRQREGLLEHAAPAIDDARTSAQ